MVQEIQCARLSRRGQQRADRPPRLAGSGLEQFPSAAIGQRLWRRRRQAVVRKLIAFDDDTFDKLTQLARDRMATIQELADEAFADLLKKHGIPVDLRDALRKSAALSRTPVKNNAAKNNVSKNNGSKNDARLARSRKSTS